MVERFLRPPWLSGGGGPSPLVAAAGPASPRLASPAPFQPPRLSALGSRERLGGIVHPLLLLLLLLGGWASKALALSGWAVSQGKKPAGLGGLPDLRCGVGTNKLKCGPGSSWGSGIFFISTLERVGKRGGTPVAGRLLSRRNFSERKRRLFLLEPLSA